MKAGTVFSILLLILLFVAFIPIQSHAVSDCDLKADGITNAEGSSTTLPCFTVEQVAITQFEAEEAQFSQSGTGSAVPSDPGKWDEILPDQEQEDGQTQPLIPDSQDVEFDPPISSGTEPQSQTSVQPTTDTDFPPVQSGTNQANQEPQQTGLANPEDGVGPPIAPSTIVPIPEEPQPDLHSMSPEELGLSIPIPSTPASEVPPQESIPDQPAVGEDGPPIATTNLTSVILVFISYLQSIPVFGNCDFCSIFLFKFISRSAIDHVMAR